MSRTVPLSLMMLLAVSLAAAPVVPRSGDPSLDGKDYLLSEADFRALLAVARAHLASFRPRPSIYRVTVVSAREVDAWYGDPSDIDSECLILERGKKGWRIARTGGIQRS
jgi:hypothetical protein